MLRVLRALIQGPDADTLQEIHGKVLQSVFNMIETQNAHTAKNAQTSYWRTCKAMRGRMTVDKVTMEEVAYSSASMDNVIETATAIVLDTNQKSTFLKLYSGFRNGIQYPFQVALQDT